MKFSYVRIITLALLMVAFAANAQRVPLKKADRYFELFKFDKAIKQYEKVLDKYPGNEVANERLAACYRLLGKTEQAEAWYAKAVQKEGAAPILTYYYAQALRSNGKYEEAKAQYEAYASKAPDDPRGSSLANAMDTLSVIKADSLHYRVWNVDSLNTDVSEFSPAYYKDSTLAFVSNRTAVGKKKDVWADSQALLNLYLAEFGDSSKITVSDLQGKVNTRYHEGPLVFSKDLSKVYFTRNVVVNGFKKEGEDDIIRLNVFSADNKNGEWKNAKPLPFNSKDFSCAHPALSADGKTLYFSSDMEGGYGGYDLWKVTIDSTGGWGEPINLGDVVNSPGNEEFPFMHEDGSLYFSADAYIGFGGLDIYQTKETDGVWSKPANMGYPINTHYDDLGLIMNKEKNGGYLSSNRAGGHGDDDIYQFDDKVTIPLVGTTFEVAVNDDSLVEGRKGTLDSVWVYLYNTTDGTIDTTLSDAEGKYKFLLKPEKNYRLVAEKDFYFLKSEKTLSTIGATGDTLKAELELYKIQGVIRLVNIYYDFDKYNIRPDAAKELDRVYQLLEKYPDMEIELRSHTDCRGTATYNDRLSSNRAKSAVQYLVKKGKNNGLELLPRVVAASFGESMPVYADLCDTEQGLRDNEISKELADKHQVNRRTEFVVTKQPEAIKVKSSIPVDEKEDNEDK